MPMTPHPAASLLLKLQHYTVLSHEDRAAFFHLRMQVAEAQPRRDIVSEGDRTAGVRLILRGWACRYKSLSDGRRQIVGFFIPGDMCDLNVHVLRTMDHSIGAITRVEYGMVAPDDLSRLTQAHPRILQALFWNELVNSSIQREWLLNVGQRSAYERIAHLFVELFMRLQAVNLTQGQSCEFPITQADIAEATGLTPVHVNRTLQQLRQEGLIALAHRLLRIPDLDSLRQAAMFNAGYLHLDHEGRHLDANNHTAELSRAS